MGDIGAVAGWCQERRTYPRIGKLDGQIRGSWLPLEEMGRDERLGKADDRGLSAVETWRWRRLGTGI